MTNVDLSRRDFLKILGFGSVVAVGGMLGLPQAVSSREASAQVDGAWALGAIMPFPTVHATLLRTGKIMTTPGSGWQFIDRDGPFNVSVIDLENNTRFDSTVVDDVFCCGFAQLADGNILIAGGTISYADGPDGKYHGGNFAYEFDVDTTTWNKVSDMVHGRWYPAMGTLADGKVYVMTGLDEYGTENDLTEIYDPVSKTFSIKYDPTTNNTYCVGAGSSLPGAGSPCYGGPNQGTNHDFSFYGRFMLMPSGLLFLAGMRQTLRTWNPVTGEWNFQGNAIAEGRSYGTAVLLPLENNSSERGRVLMVGGQKKGSLLVQNSAEIVTFDSSGDAIKPTVAIDSMTHPRMYLDPVIIPTGKVIIFGGTSDSNVTSVLNPEMFDPDTNTWTILPPASVGRFYHSTSLLLPDGRVWVSSGTPNMNIFQAQTEFFSPWYMFAGPRPTISSDPTFQRILGEPYSGTITIPTPDGLDISSVSLIRLGNVTHHFDAEARCLWLGNSNVPFSKSGSDVVVNAPINANLAPPGYYMIHILNEFGIPSIAKIIPIGSDIIESTDTLPPVIGISSPSARSPIVGPSGGVPITITGTASDPSSGVESVIIQIDSGSDIPATSTLNNYEMWSASTTILTQGPHKIKAIATDNDGNISSIEIPITVFFS